MNPINNQNPVIEPDDVDEPSVDDAFIEQIEQQVIESAKNIVEPAGAMVVEPLKPFANNLNDTQPQAPVEPSQVVVTIVPEQDGSVQSGITNQTVVNSGEQNISQPVQPVAPVQPPRPPEGTPLQQNYPQQPPMPQLPQSPQFYGPQPQVVQPGQFGQAPQMFQSNQAPQQPVAPQPFNATQAPLQNFQQPTILMGSVDVPATTNQFNPNFNPPKPPSKKKYLIGGLVGMFVVLSGVAAFLFLIYLPNLPQNVWNTGMTRTGKQVSLITKKINEPASKAKIEKNKITLKGTFDISDANYSVNLDSKLDKANSNSTAKVKADSKDGKNSLNIDAEVNTKAIENAMYPNIYFKISGFSSLGLDSLMPGVNNYDGKWIAAEQDYLKQFESKTTTDSKQKNITEEDVLSIMNDANIVTQQFVFTNDQTKAIMTKTSFKGTEKSENITANHYTAKLNAENVKSYCTAMVDKMSANASVKKISGQTDADFAKYVQDAKDECSKAKPYDKDFDIWIDKKFKLFHKIRLYEDVEKNNEQTKTDKAQCLKDMGADGQTMCAYFDEQIESGERYQEIGQVLKSRDEFVMFVGGNANTDKDKSKYRMELSVNAKTLVVGGTMKASSDSANNKYTLDLNISTEPYNGEINTEKPAGAIPIKQVLDTLKIGTN